MNYTYTGAEMDERNERDRKARRRALRNGVIVTLAVQAIIGLILLAFGAQRAHDCRRAINVVESTLACAAMKQPLVCIVSATELAESQLQRRFIKESCNTQGEYP